MIMPLLDILIFPDPRLKNIAAPVQQVDSSIKQIVENMLATMYHAEGIGLAATQVNIHKRIIVIDISENRKVPMCFINPVITQHSGEIVWEEGCLSFPDLYAKVKRYATISIEYHNLENTPQTLQADGLLSICLQHEIDHINGITFYDRISPLRKTLLRKKIKTLGKQ
jgi:peptide deformylase